MRPLPQVSQHIASNVCLDRIPWLAPRVNNVVVNFVVSRLCATPLSAAMRTIARSLPALAWQLCQSRRSLFDELSDWPVLDEEILDRTAAVFDTYQNFMSFDKT